MFLFVVRACAKIVWSLRWKGLALFYYPPYSLCIYHTSIILMKTLHTISYIIIILLPAVRAAIDLATRLTDQYRLSDSNKTEKTNLPASVASLSKQDQEHVREAMRPFQPPSSPSSSDLNGLNGQSQNQSHLYELQSVIMHRGSAYSGHYFAYVYRFLTASSRPPRLV